MTGIPPKVYLGQCKSSDEDSWDMVKNKTRKKSDGTKDKKFFRGSLNSPWFKNKESSKVNIKSILKKTRSGAYPDPPIKKTKTRVTTSTDRKQKPSSYSYESDLMRDRKEVYKNCDIELNAAKAVLHKATKDIHMFKVEIERDQTFGFGLYIYGKGPNRELPCLSIFVKSVLPRSRADRLGLFKANDQIIECNKKSFVGTTQEIAMKEFKNSSKLVLVLGRRASNLDADELMDEIAKVIDDYSRSKWFKAEQLECGDFNLISPHNFIGSFPKLKSKSKKPKSINMPKRKVDSFLPIPASSSFIKDGDSPSWQERQMHLEQRAMGEMWKREEVIKQAEVEKESMRKEMELKEKRAQMEIDFLKKQNEATRNKLVEVSEHLQADRIEQALKLSSTGTADIMDLWDDTLIEMKSWDNTSVSTEMTDSTILPYANLIEMAEIQEIISNPTTPSSIGQFSDRFNFDSNYSSRRPSTQLLSDSSCQSSNRSSRLFVDLHEEKTPTVSDLYENVNNNIDKDEDATPILPFSFTAASTFPAEKEANKDSEDSSGGDESSEEENRSNSDCRNSFDSNEDNDENRVWIVNV